MNITARCRELMESIQPAKLMVVTKNRSKKKILQVLEAGITMIGENRLQEIEKKYDNQLFTLMKHRGVALHYIGSLQSNKLPKLIKYCDVLESVSSLEMAQKIDHYAEQQGKTVPIFLQLNLTGEEQKQGIMVQEESEELASIISAIQALPHVQLLGFMCMGKQDDQAATRVAFEKCKQLADQFGLAEVSMGMSDDYPIALAAGASLVRIGSKIFGE